MPDVRAYPVANHGPLAVVSENEAARLLSVSVSTLRRLRRRGLAPRVVFLSERRLGYRIGDLEQWLEARASG
jgi:predicted DNA-binding transcriptional regulator AlpA